MNLLLPAKSLKTTKKASGLDEKSNVALRVLIQWKKQVPVLLPKSGKSTGEPSSYRPICLLNSMVNLSEPPIVGKQQTWLHKSTVFSLPNQQWMPLSKK